MTLDQPSKACSLRPGPRIGRGLALLLATGPLLALSVSPHALARSPQEASSPVSRESALVVVPGAELAEFSATPIDRLGLFAADLTAQAFVPVPFQIDERFVRVFNEGTPAEFETLIHDVFGEDDGLLDSHDELVFLFGEGGPRAPAELPWPAGAEGLRIEVSALDPREGGEKRWLYLFEGEDLERSARSYVSWNTQPSGDVETDVFVAGYLDRWILDEFLVKAPCGAGTDIIDRVKGRAVPLPGRNEDEEGWNENSLYLGGLVGPVRALRYVQGAMSGVNTIHYDEISRGSIRRVIDLRVHELFSASVYVDMLPSADGMLFTSRERGGFDVDGLPESASPLQPDWALFTSGAGGLITVYDYPPAERYESIAAIYVDDATYDDAIPENPSYGDEDDAVFGSHGFRLEGTDDSNFDSIPIRLRFWPLCSNQGDPSTGDAHLQLVEEPIAPAATPQWQALGAVRTLKVSRGESAGAQLTWDPIMGAAQGYRVYRARSASSPQRTWTRIHEGPGTSFTDDMAMGGDQVFFYSVVAFNAEGEGLW